MKYKSIYNYETKWDIFCNKIRPHWWNHFWYSYKNRNIGFGPGFYATKTFRESRLVLIIAIFGIILIITHIILKII